MKTEKEFKRNVTAAVSFCDVNPELPTSMKSHNVFNGSPETQQSLAPNNDDDDDSSWFNESAI